MARDAGPSTMPKVQHTIDPQQPRLQAPGQQPWSISTARRNVVDRPARAWRRGAAESVTRTSAMRDDVAGTEFVEEGDAVADLDTARPW